MSWLVMDDYFVLNPLFIFDLLMMTNDTELKPWNEMA